MPRPLIAIALCLAFTARARAAEGSWCKDEASCAQFCLGPKVNASAVGAKGWHEPKGLLALSAISQKLACGKGQTKAVECGFYYQHGDDKVLPRLEPALIAAVKELRKHNPDYVLVVDSAYRSVLFDTERVCKKIVAGQKEASGILCGIELACPGPNSHSNGYAVDVHLQRKDKLFDKNHHYNSKGALTPPPGLTKTCKASVEGIHKEKDQHMRMLNQRLFALGFWRYCWEDWHFELSPEPLNALRTNCLADSDCRNGKTCQAHPPPGHPKDSVMVCK